MEKHGGLILPHLQKKESGKKQENGRLPLKEPSRHVQQQEGERISGRHILKSETFKSLTDKIWNNKLQVHLSTCIPEQFSFHIQTCSQHLILRLSISFKLLLFSCQVVFDSSQPHSLQHTRLPCPLPSPGICPSSSPLHQWCHSTISSSVIPFFSCPQSFPASGSFKMNQIFTSGGQSIGSSASASVLSKSLQSWFPLRWTGLISLFSKGLS